MKRPQKTLLAILGSLAVAILLLATAAPFVVNVERLRPQAEARLRAALGRDVSLGALTLSLWTGPALRTASLRIGTPLDGSADSGLSVETGSTSVHLAWIPLLRHDVEVRSITTVGLSATAHGRPLLSNVRLASRLRTEKDGTVRSRGSMEGRLAALATAPRVRARFAATIRAGTLEITSLDAACGPVRIDAAGRLSGALTPAPRLGLEGSAKLLRTRVNGHVAVDLTAPHPRASFDLVAPLLDASEVMAAVAAISRDGSTPRTSASWLIPAANAGGSVAAAGRSFLRGLEAAGTLRAERCVAKGLEMTDVSTRVSVLDGQARFDDTRVSLYGGTATGAVSMLPFEARTPFTLDQTAVGIAIRPLIAALAPAQADTVDGEASLTIHVRGDASGGAVLPSMSGQGQVVIANGTIASVGVIKQVMKALESAGARGLTKDESPFDHLSARFDLAESVASTRNLEFRSRDLDFDGAGTVALGGALKLDVVSRFSKAMSDDLVAETRALAFRQAADGRLSVPLRIRGTIRDPKVQLDLERVIDEGLLNEMKKLLGR